MIRRVHIFGASGSGTTTLAKALANVREWEHIDTDDVYWLPSEPPFRTPRPLEARQRLLHEGLQSTDSWVLSGSLCGWGNQAIPLFDLVVFLWVPADVRLARLRLREIARYGPGIEDPMDPMNEKHQAFLAWAGAYDAGDLSMRSRALHEAWIESLPWPVVRIEGASSVERSLQIVLEEIRKADSREWTA